jgi:diacylglycerol O-acyltransferase
MHLEAKSEPLTGVDHAWLRMESRVNPMVITALIVVDGRLEPGRLEAVLEERLLPHARFRQRVVGGAPWTTPRWELDPEFDLRNHVIRERLPPPGGRKWLEVRVGELFGQPMNRRRPLWDVRVFDDFEGGTAIVCRFHHAVADGMALLRILLSLTDAGEDTPDPRPPRPQKRNGVTPTALLDPDRLLRLAKHGANGAVALGRLLLLPPETPTPIRGRLTRRKAASWSEPFAIPDIKAIGKKVGGTVNDALLAALAGALGTYLEERNLTTEGLDLRAVVPVDLRPTDRPPAAGNFFGLVFLDLPVGIRDPLERLRETKRRMDRIKSTPEAAAVFQLLHAVGYTAPVVEEAALRYFGSKASAVVSNVPGPKECRILAGREIRDILFWVPESGGIGFGASFFGYRERIRVGVVTDASLVPEPAVIAAGVEAEVDRLAAI